MNSGIATSADVCFGKAPPIEKKSQAAEENENGTYICRGKRQRNCGHVSNQHVLTQRYRYII